MLNIPFVNTYIRIVKHQPVADNVDWLNYYVSSLMLIFCALAISAKQYFGAPIQCWIPNEFKSGWEKYAEDYCFIANSYYVPMDQEVPSDLQAREDKLSYYRWVPIILALQSVLFWMPNYLWNILHKQTALNPRALVHEARKSRALCGAEREKELAGLAQYIHDTIQVFDPKLKGRIARSGFNATFLYLGMKLLYVLNAVGQLVMLNYFLGGSYFYWGYQTVRDVVQGNEWTDSEIFPRVIMCDFTIRRMANQQRWSVQCVLMMNMINEKLYLFLYFWLMFVAIVSLLNFFYCFVMIVVPALRIKFVLYNVSRKDLELQGLRYNDIQDFVDYLHCDGVLALHFIRQHIGGRIAFDLINELIRRFFNHRSGANTPSKSSGRSDQLLLRGDNYKRNITDLPNTYKSTIYAPGMLYPRSSAPKQDESIDYIDDGTLPLRSLHTPSQTPAIGNLDSENLYTPPPATKSSMSSV